MGATSLAGRWLLLAATSAGCRGAAVPAPASPPPAIEWAGCQVVRNGPVCVLGADRRLTVWVAAGPEAIGTLRTDQGPPGIRSRARLGEGTQLVVEPPAGARLLEVNVRGSQPWRLALETARPDPGLEMARRSSGEGRYQDAVLALETLRDRTSSGGRGPVVAALARAELSLGHLEAAEKNFRLAMAAARAEGRRSDLVKDGLALFWVMVELQQRFVEARALLQELTPDALQVPEGRVYLAFNRAQLAQQTADFRGALDDLRAAEGLSRKIGLGVIAQKAGIEISRILVRLGRSAEAVPLLQAALASAEPRDPCTNASWHLNFAWAGIERALATEPPGGGAELEGALKGARRAAASCPDAHIRLLGLINEAEYALSLGDAARAARIVGEWNASPLESPGALFASWQADVQGRLELLLRRPAQALAFFTRQAAAASAADLREEQFRARVGAGRACLALRRRQEAVAHLRDAQGLLEGMVRGIPLGEGRGSFLGARDEGVRYLVAALVEVGATEEAMRTARVARVAAAMQAVRQGRLDRMSAGDRQRWDQALGRYWRLRHAMESQAAGSWSTPREELGRAREEREAQALAAHAALDEAYSLLEQGASSPALPAAPRKGELQLAIFPAPRGWFAFAATEAGIRARKLAPEELSSAASAGALLDAFSAEISRARRISILAHGAAEGIDWHAVLFRQRALLRGVEVEWRLDLPQNADDDAPDDPQAGPGQAQPRRALIVANPTGDLAAAKSESVTVAGALASWAVERLDGPAATREAILAALERSFVFHYSGHAQAAGTEGMASALITASGARIDLRDLLALRRVPRLVFLSACEAAAGGDGGPALGLAQAFLMAGARAVVAPTRPVRDDLAAAFASAFYRVLSAQPAMDLHASFRRAAMDVADREPNADWASFRLLVR